MIKTSLIISLLAYIMFWLANYRVRKIYKKKFQSEKDIKIGLCNHTRVFLMVLIPIFNLLCLIVWSYFFLFRDDKIILRELQKIEE